MKETFTEKLRLNKDNKQKLVVINKIIEEYSKQGYRLTLRQLYYQLVSRDIIANNLKEYAKLSKLLVQGRMAGIVDWDAIEDRIRVPFIPYWVEDIADAIRDTVNQYRLDRMENQDVYIEVWVEKDALSGVLKRITSHYHINLMVNRGYSSCTAMHDASERIKEKQDEKKCYILYLGDHDPSGVDMVRDIESRLEEFGAEVEVERIALTQEQIKKYSPPPNPAKIKDPRAKDYIAKFGNTSWEVDALNPEILHRIIRKSVEELIDSKKFEEKLEQEKLDKKKLEKFTNA
ncbi:MAG: hypothetical protein AAB706_00620 [Patescibacteria group bacterium]